MKSFKHYEEEQWSPEQPRQSTICQGHESFLLEMKVQYYKAKCAQLKAELKRTKAEPPKQKDPSTTRRKVRQLEASNQE